MKTNDLISHGISAVQSSGPVGWIAAVAIVALLVVAYVVKVMKR